MWGYPEFYIPVPGGYDAWVTPPWNRDSSSSHQREVHPPGPGPEPEPA